MNNNKYLNEEKYHQTKKKITKISLIILILGLIVGGALIITAVIKQNNAKKADEQAYNEAYKQSENAVAEANARLKEIDEEKKELKSKIEAKKYECDSLNMRDPNWFSDVNKCNSESSDLTSQLNDLEMEEFTLEHANYTVYYDKVSKMTYIPFYMFGAFVIIASCMAAGSIYLFTKRREIAAFTTQQVMPVAQEGISTMAPTIGSAAGTIGKEIAKGISDGINESKEVGN